MEQNRLENSQQGVAEILRVSAAPPRSRYVLMQSRSQCDASGDGLCTVPANQSISLSMATYASGDRTIRIDQHEPSGPGPFPALLLLHGSGGAVSYWLHQFAPMLGAAGFAIYAPHYFDKTGTQRATAEMILDGRHFPQWLRAAQDSLAYLATRPKVDARRIGVLGISLGGYLATALAIDERGVRAAVELSGGVPPGWERRASSAMAPMLVLHGEQDTIVPVSEAQKLETLLQQHRVPSRVEIFPNETHWFSPAAQLKLLMLCGQFFSKHL